VTSGTRAWLGNNRDFIGLSTGEEVHACNSTVNSTIILACFVTLIYPLSVRGQAACLGRVEQRGAGRLIINKTNLILIFMISS
jgi:hypothetical protein